tara:strand:- start:2364 stop:3422 length:1059 start_codon:yes stop_codon:yes gene_type:complete
MPHLIPFADTTAWALGLTIAALVILLVVSYIFFSYFRLYIQCKLTRAGIGFMDLLSMTFKKIPVNMIVQCKIMAVKADLTEDEGVTVDALCAHHLSGGNVSLVIRSLIAARKAKIIKLTFIEAMAIDRAGRNVLESVQTSVYPKVIDCPSPNSGKRTLDAVARDGIQLQVKARVTVRSNLQQLIGGASEETIMARVGEGIVSAIGSIGTYSKVLENPDLISRTVLAKNLDSQTAFEIVSIDIADIDVGTNIGARLQADQAEADTRVARARAEGRRAMAVAAEQEQIAAIAESEAELVKAEATVPKSIAEALNSHRLSIMDYYRIRNIQADTKMRTSFSSTVQDSASVDDGDN